MSKLTQEEVDKQNLQGLLTEAARVDDELLKTALKEVSKRIAYLNTEAAVKSIMGKIIRNWTDLQEQLINGTMTPREFFDRNNKK